MALDFEAEAQAGPTEEHLRLLASLVTDATQLEAEIARDAEALKNKEKRLRGIVEGEIPQLFAEAGGLRRIDMADGTSVTVDRKLYCSVPQGRKRWVMEWLEKRGHTALIQCDVVASPQAGNPELRERILAALKQAVGHEANDVPVREDVSVNTSRLKSLLNECLLAGDIAETDLPEFGAYLRQAAKIKRKK